MRRMRLAALILALGTPVLYAQSTLVNACVGKLSGIPRIVATPADCLNFEYPTSWSIKGPAGSAGPAGAPGLPGLPGPQGVAGPAGKAGSIGPQGPAGVAGKIGAAGPQGLTGATGAQGAPGVTGPQGLTGATGATGPQGLTGAVGPQGLTGVSGATGPQGLAGATGPQGTIGPAGPIGQQGAVGPQGVDGPQGLPGAQGPSGGVGPQGPPGIGFNFIIPVPATTDPFASGNALAAAITAFSATANSGNVPVVFALDAGVYSVPSTLVLPAGASITGAGLASTILQAANPGSVLNIISISNASLNPLNQGLVQLTIIGAPALQAQTTSLLVLDHVQLLPSATQPTATPQPNTIILAPGSGQYLITDSVLGPTAFSWIGGPGPGSSPTLPGGWNRVRNTGGGGGVSGIGGLAVFRPSAGAHANAVATNAAPPSNTLIDLINGTEVDGTFSNPTNAPYVQLCTASYNASGTTVDPALCQ